MKHAKRKLRLETEVIRRIDPFVPRELDENEVRGAAGGGSLKCSFGAAPGCV